MNLIEIARMTEDEARDYFESMRWPNGPVCPHCQSQQCTRLQGKASRPGTIQCNNCREQFTVTVKSVLESSKVSLVKWVMAFHLLCTSKKGFSALQLQRELGLGSYRTAWFMMHRVRHAMTEGIETPMTGVVEMDETYVGARRPRVGTSKQGRGTNKIPVVALVQRGGDDIRTQPVETVSSVTLGREARKHISPEAILVTDENSCYDRVGKEFAEHHTINHSQKIYARRDERGFPIHTQTVDCFFSLVKRSHMGIYHVWNKHHLGRYITEIAFRWRHRKTTDEARRETALSQIGGKRLKYKTSA
jgi:transposase-like protein